MEDNDLADWLKSLPVNEPVTIDGESVCLLVRENGAELCGYFMQSFGDNELETALRMGFESATEFDAGWSISPDDGALMLTQWLPLVDSWMEAVEPLENLLDQLATLRTALEPPEPTIDPIRDRDEQRLRMLLTRGE
jgi:hypothetical protein